MLKLMSQTCDLMIYVWSDLDAPQHRRYNFYPFHLAWKVAFYALALFLLLISLVVIACVFLYDYLSRVPGRIRDFWHNWQYRSTSNVTLSVAPIITPWAPDYARVPFLGKGIRLSERRKD